MDFSFFPSNFLHVLWQIIFLLAKFLLQIFVSNLFKISKSLMYVATDASCISLPFLQLWKQIFCLFQMKSMMLFMNAYTCLLHSWLFTWWYGCWEGEEFRWNRINPLYFLIPPRAFYLCFPPIHIVNTPLPYGSLQTLAAESDKTCIRCKLSLWIMWIRLHTG